MTMNELIMKAREKKCSEKSGRPAQRSDPGDRTDGKR